MRSMWVARLAAMGAFFLQAVDAAAVTAAVPMADGKAEADYAVTVKSDSGALASGLQMYYAFADSSDLALDASGNGHDGVLHGTTWAEEGPRPGCRQFGTGNYIDAGSTVNFASWEQYSISVWFRRDTSIGDTTGYGDKLFCKTTWYNDEHLRVIPDGSLHFNVFTGGGPYPIYGYGASCYQDFRDNHWHHVAIIRDGTRIEMWIDGELRSASSNAVTITSNTQPIYLGYSPSPDSYQKRYWPGAIDEFRIYNRALGSNEVAELYAPFQGCTVALDAGEGRVSPSSVAAMPGEAYGSLPEPSRTGYTFGAWQLNLAGETSVVTAETVVSVETNHTLTASWTANTYTVGLEANGGWVSPASVEVTYDSAYGELPVPVPPETVRLPYVFGGWFTAEGAAVDAGTAVSTAGDHTLYALWLEPPYLPDPSGDAGLSGGGAYDGYFYAAEDVGGATCTVVRGSLSLNVATAAGKVTAKAVTRNGPLSFGASAWDSVGTDGTARVSMSLKGGETLELNVRQNRVWGSLAGGSLGDGALLLDGARNRFRDRGDAAAQAALSACEGYYTVSLPAEDLVSQGEAEAAPRGAGYLTLKISSAGSAKLAGALADGTSFSAASRVLLLGDGGWVCVPLACPLYARKGWVGGLLWIDPDSRTVVTDRELGWLVRWDQSKGAPSDFDEVLFVYGGYYEKSPELLPLYLFSARPGRVPYPVSGGFVDPVSKAFPVEVPVAGSGARLSMEKGMPPYASSGEYVYPGENSSMAKMSFSPSTGIFKGSFYVYYDYEQNGWLRHVKVAVPYKGILIAGRGGEAKSAVSVDALPAVSESRGTVGFGHCLVPDSDPAVKAYRIKRSFMAGLYPLDK